MVELVQLLGDVGVLGKGVLIMSGHDDEYQPASIPPSPVVGEGDGAYSTPPPSAAETSTPPSHTVAPPAGIMPSSQMLPLFLFIYLFLRQNAERSTSQHMRQLTTWQVFVK